jgi:hypothetical protein
LFFGNVKIKIYRTIIVPFISYGCETWSLTHRFRVTENRVLRRMFGTKRQEMVEGWRRLHNVELRNLFASSNIIRVTNSKTMSWAEHVAHMWEMRHAYTVLVGNPERKHSEDLDVDGRII